MYNFNFEPVLAGLDQLLIGAWLTIQLSCAAMILGLIVSVLCAAGKTSGVVPLRWIIDAYIEIIRNTPFLVQIFFIFFGLPSLGLRLTPNGAALLALVVNFGAYGTEIIRAGIESIQKGQVEAGTALGLSKLPIFRYSIKKPAQRTGADQPVHLPDADLERRFGNLGRRSGCRRQRPAIGDLREFRGVYRHHAHVSRHVGWLLGSLLRHREGRLQVSAEPIGVALC